MDLRLLTWLSHSLQGLRLVPIAAGILALRSRRYAQEPWMRWLLAYLILDAAFEVVLLTMALHHRRTYGLLDLALVPTFAFQSLILSRMPAGDRLRGPLLAAGLLIFGVATWEGWRGGLHPKWAVAMVLAGLSVLTASLWLAFQGLLDPSPVPLTERPAFWLTGSWTIEQGSLMLLAAGTSYFLRTLSPAWVGLPWIANDLLCGALQFSMAKVFLCPSPTSS